MNAVSSFMKLIWSGSFLLFADQFSFSHHEKNEYYYNKCGNDSSRLEMIPVVYSGYRNDILTAGAGDLEGCFCASVREYHFQLMFSCRKTIQIFRLKCEDETSLFLAEVCFIHFLSIDLYPTELIKGHFIPGGTFKGEGEGVLASPVPGISFSIST